MQAQFDRLRAMFDAPNLRCLPVLFQDYADNREGFDTILLLSSINHLDEEACVRLHGDPAARDVYRGLLTRLFDVANDGAVMIVTDATNTDLYHALGRRNPFFPQVERHKHQPPSVWVNLLTEVGFHSPTVSWNPVKRLGVVGRALTSNRLAALVTLGQFRILVRK